MMPLTPREAEALEFIKAQLKNHGVAPSFDEILAALKLSSKSRVSTLMWHLERKGFIYRMPGRARAIQLVQSEDHYSADCDCVACIGRRYRDSLKLIDATKHDAPAHLEISFFHRGQNLKPLPVGKRASWLRVSVRALQSTSSKAAPARAIPSGGST